ncbi:IS5 family transposase [Nocardiopsis sp. FIRDI 009]|uniref:IS5 family transposase n=1 Tax=Nocardiopsis sp. FIRDI 009 TaxID=714197 RepID=UPI000E23AC97|nr:IS5 family transposase [Nocardiopsis sp. FIRDI 009]
MASRRPHRTDLSDERWALIEPTLTAWREARRGLGIKKPTHDLREIVNAIGYVNRTGIAWEYLPHDFPPHKTVYGYFSAWQADGTTERIHDLLRRRTRHASGRKDEPTAAIIDAQTVPTSSNVAESEQGYDAGKRVKGRKRHIATDTPGLLLAVIVIAAHAWVDSGYKTRFAEHAARAGITIEAVAREPGQRGFRVLPRRWAVERTFGWLVLHRRLTRDHEARSGHARSMVHWAMIDVMSRRLTGGNTPIWRDAPTEPGTPPAT